MSKKIAVETVRKWHITVCNDLCLPIIPVIVRGFGGGGAAGRFIGERKQAASGFLAFNFDGFILGAPVGGGVTTNCGIEIYDVDGYGERDYLRTLAHEARHAWQFLNGQPPTEEDCDNYAERFLSRFYQPNYGRYEGLVSDREYVEAERIARETKQKQQRRFWKQFGLALVVASALASICFFLWTPMIGSGGGMYRPADVPAAIATARMWGCVFAAPPILFIILYLTLSPFGNAPAKPSRGLGSAAMYRKVAYAKQIRDHPDNGKDGRWELCGCLVRAKSAEEAIEKVAAAGRLDDSYPVPRYRGPMKKKQG